jgi:hypothetical protein
MGDQNIGFNNGYLYYGKLIFSNDGTKMLAVAPDGIINLFDFDRCTGLLSNYRDIGEHINSPLYSYESAAFSPNGNVIYVSTNYNTTKNIYQWNLLDTNIQSSKTLINHYPDTGLVQWNTYGWHNLAPDGKIYVPVTANYQGPNQNNVTTQYLDAIDYPDSVGLACHYRRQAFYLGGHFAGSYLPNMAYFGLGPVTGSICDSLSIGINENERKNGLEVYPNPSNGYFYFKLKDATDKVVSISLKNVMGREIYSAKNNSSSIDATTFPPGIYIAKVFTQKKKLFTVKVVKQ